MSPRLHNPTRVRDGFTLIELLVVIGILAVLAALALPALQSAKARGLEAKSASNLRQIASALLAYAADNNSQLPATSPGGDKWNTSILPPFLGLPESSIFQPAGDSDPKWSDLAPIFLAPTATNLSETAAYRTYAKNCHLALGPSEAAAYDGLTGAVPIRLVSMEKPSAGAMVFDWPRSSFNVGQASDAAKLKAAFARQGGRAIQVAYADAHVGRVNLATFLTHVQNRNQQGSDAFVFWTGRTTRLSAGY